MLSLLAFVLALTLSFANTRFSERVEGTLAEANAIGTAWLRAEAIGHVRGPEIAKLLEEYTFRPLYEAIFYDGHNVASPIASSGPSAGNSGWNRRMARAAA
jgi:hypothetical protein